MDIADIFEKIVNARIAHLNWVEKAEALVGGLPLDKNQIPLLATDCDFGQWYLKEGRVLRHLPAYKIVAIHHQQLHRIYMEIFKLMFSDEERLNIFKWLGIQRQVNQSKQSQASKLIPSLKAASREILKDLDQLTSEFSHSIKLQNSRSDQSTDELDILFKELKDMGYTGRQR